MATPIALLPSNNILETAEFVRIVEFEGRLERKAPEAVARRPLYVLC